MVGQCSFRCHGKDVVGREGNSWNPRSFLLKKEGGSIHVGRWTEPARSHKGEGGDAKGAVLFQGRGRPERWSCSMVPGGIHVLWNLKHPWDTGEQPIKSLRSRHEMSFPLCTTDTSLELRLSFLNWPLLWGKHYLSWACPKGLQSFAACVLLLACINCGLPHTLVW